MSEAQVQEEKSTFPEEMIIRTPGGEEIYRSSQEEFDDCFYQVLALGSFAKTFKIGDKLELTFMTISQGEKMELLKSVREWANGEDASTQMFDLHLTKMNLSHYLATISIDGSIINLRGEDIEKRLELLTGMADQAISFYGMYLYGFQELVRRSLMAKTAVKN